MEMLCKIIALGDSIHDMHSLAVAHPTLESAVLWYLGQYKCHVTLLADFASISFWTNQGNKVFWDFIEPEIVRFGNDIPSFPALWALVCASTKSIAISIPNPHIGYTHQQIITFADNLFLIHTSGHVLEEVKIRPQRARSTFLDYRGIDPVLRFALFNLMKDTSIEVVDIDGFDNLGTWGGFPKRSVQIITKYRAAVY